MSIAIFIENRLVYPTAFQIINHSYLHVQYVLQIEIKQIACLCCGDVRFRFLTVNRKTLSTNKLSTLK